ncbi:MAG: DUF2007 domain-containing protein [Acidobacteriaceae bacterium]|nr:DUF2007 domain-containing protein [Acidobacteriaceae bacterium]
MSFLHEDHPDYAELYRSMYDDELLHLASDWDSLVEAAQFALTDELASRKLSRPTTTPAQKEDEGREEEKGPAYDGPLVTIRSYRDLSEALIAQGAVESAGITCILKDENMVRLNWQISNVVGEVSLQVPPEDAQDAEAVLAQPIPESIPLPDKSAYDQPRCPQCNSTDIFYERHGRKIALVSLSLLGLPLPRGSESWRCNHCGLRWVEEDNHSESSIVTN